MYESLYICVSFWLWQHHSLTILHRVHWKKLSVTIWLTKRYYMWLILQSLDPIIHLWAAYCPRLIIYQDDGTAKHLSRTLLNVNEFLYERSLGHAIYSIENVGESCLDNLYLTQIWILIHMDINAYDIICAAVNWHNGNNRTIYLLLRTVQLCPTSSPLFVLINQ